VAPHRSTFSGVAVAALTPRRSTPRARPFLASLLVGAAVLAAAASPVAARNGSAHNGGGGGGGGGGTSSSPAGNDISWPQCGKTFPSGQTFGIVGVNDGLANTLNPCLGPYKNGGPATSELVWALGSAVSTPLPAASLYVNTADPGPGVADWPANNNDPLSGAVIDDPYGTCNGLDSTACAWQYGWDRAVQDVAWLAKAATDAGVAGAVNVPGDAASYPWWLDVETANSWETGAGSPGTDNNVADLQGMVAALKAAGALHVGIYSTSYQWGVITGGSTDGNLSGLDDWIPGARTQSAAQSNCSLAGFTGNVTITQWFGKPYDGDWAC
jgi:hypothetical protein